jgi:hypothetical protein
MADFDIQIPRQINLSTATVISHTDGEKIFKISNFIEKLKIRLKNINVEKELQSQIIAPCILEHLQEYHCVTALEDGLTCETLSPESPEW